MSHDADTADTHHDLHHDDGGHPPSTLKGYLTGFILSVVLTAIPFWLVMTGAIADKYATTLIIMSLAAIQIVVHMIYFLHMNARAEGGWSMLALIFTIIMVVITLSGSLWVMYHMISNMMPTAQDMGRLP